MKTKLTLDSLFSIVMSLFFVGLAIFIAVFFISTFSFSGFIVITAGSLFCSAVPLFLFFEIYHRLKKQNQITHPFAKGILASFMLSVVATVVFIATSGGGEQSFGALLIAPLFFIGFMVMGILVAWVYKLRNCQLLFGRNSVNTIE